MQQCAKVRKSDARKPAYSKPEVRDARSRKNTRSRRVANVASPKEVRNPDTRKSPIAKPQNPQGPQMLRKPSTASRGVAKIASPEGVRNPDARKSSISKPKESEVMTPRSPEVSDFAQAPRSPEAPSPKPQCPHLGLESEECKSLIYYLR